MSKKNKDVSSAQEAASTPKKGPFKVFKLEDVSVSIFRHERENAPANFSCGFSRSYKDSTGTWKRTQWFGLEELGKLITLAQQAADFIQQEQEAA